MTFLSEIPGGATFIPNRLLDEVMPQLKDTEWRVLLVICRQTLGRVERDGSRRKSDWLSQSQLKEKTGRASEAVSRAIDILVRKALIEVCDESGEILLSAQSRRASHGRLFFRLSPRLLRSRSAGSQAPLNESSKIEYRKANTTKRKNYKRIYIERPRKKTVPFAQSPMSEIRLSTRHWTRVGDVRPNCLRRAKGSLQRAPHYRNEGIGISRSLFPEGISNSSATDRPGSRGDFSSSRKE